MGCDSNFVQHRQFSLNVSQEPACTRQGKIKVAGSDFEPNTQCKKNTHYGLEGKKNDQEEDWMPARCSKIIYAVERGHEPRSRTVDPIPPIHYRQLWGHCVCVSPCPMQLGPERNLIFQLTYKQVDLSGMQGKSLNITRTIYRLKIEHLPKHSSKWN